MRKLLVLLVGLSFALGVQSVRAQVQSRADLYPADTSAFPKISALMDVYDSTGTFASGLKPEAVTVMEDGLPVPLTSLNEQAVPLQIVVAVNQGSALDYRDTNGLSRFDRVTQVLANWAQTLPADLPDDMSLVSQAGPVVSHASAADFIVSLNSFKPDLRAATPNLQSLVIAMDTVSAQTPRLGMKRAILFITPHMDDAGITTAIEPYIQQANERGIRIFIWFVDTETFFSTTSAAAFNALAMGSGGSMFGYSGSERFPDPEAYFSSMRRVYALSYASRLKIAGGHTLSAQVTLLPGTVTSAEQSFDMDIQPPNPFMATPPEQITRGAPADDPFNTEILLPTEQQIDIIIEFPDGHKRPLKRTTLYVDGQIAGENTAEPFDKFTWDLSAYNLSGEHQIIVEAVDSLGLSKSSMSVPVTVTVAQPPHGVAALLAKYRQPIIIGAISIAGLALLVILLSGRVRVPTLRARREARRVSEDPLTQSIQTVEEIPAPVVGKKPKWRLFTPKTAAAPKPKKTDAPASFIRINSDGQPATVSPIALREKEMTFGTDPVQCNHVLDDASLSPLHARLRQTDDGGYLLLDNNSIAGTWVNFEPVPREGYRLVHNDMVHFGQLIYRFTLRIAPIISNPKVTVVKPEE
jgi:hypothetical protein